MGNSWRRSWNRRHGRIEITNPTRRVREAAKTVRTFFAIARRARVVATPRLVEAGAAEKGSGVVARCVRKAFHAFGAVGVLPGGTGVRARRGGLLPRTPAHEGIAVLTRRVRVARHPVGTGAIRSSRAREGTAPCRLIEASAAEGRQILRSRRYGRVGRLVDNVAGRVSEAGKILWTVARKAGGTRSVAGTVCVHEVAPAVEGILVGAGCESKTAHTSRAVGTAPRRTWVITHCGGLV